MSGPAIHVENLSKLYRRMAPGFQLRTLKSALVDRSLVRGLRPEETIPALKGVTFEVAEGVNEIEFTIWEYEEVGEEIRVNTLDQGGFELDVELELF